MRKILLAILVTLAMTTNAQVLSNSTARYYLPQASSFTQSQIDSFNSAVNYQVDIINGVALTYPDLQPISLTWNGMAWQSPQPVAITTNFTTLLMVGALSHTSTSTPGALAPVVNIDWADVPGVSQYRFRFRPIGGVWNPSTITGSQRSMTTLAYNTTYEVQVRVYLSATIQGEYSQTYTFTTPTYTPLPTCNAPIVTATATSDSIALSWLSVGQGVAYQVTVRELGTLLWGGTTITGTTYKFNSAGKAYEYLVRTSCVGASTQWSEFSPLDTATSAVCTAPLSFNATGKTFSWTSYPYANWHQISVRKVGTLSWGGTSTAANTITFNTLTPGTYEWRVRSRCHSTTNTGWTAFSPIQTHTVVSAQMFEEFNTELAYPNPASDQVHLAGEIVLRDLQGRVVATGMDVLDVSSIADGMYFINNQKLIIKH